VMSLSPGWVRERDLLRKAGQKSAASVPLTASAVFAKLFSLLIKKQR
jgi:hypothetical protein